MVVERSGRRAAPQPSAQARRERSGGASAAGAAGAIKLSAEAQQLVEGGQASKHDVTKGDTLWGIWTKSVKSKGVSFEQFKAANPHLVENPARNAGNLIVPGDEVIIPQAQGWAPQGGGRTNAGRATAEAQSAQGPAAAAQAGDRSPAEQAQTAALNKFIEDAIRVNVEQQAGRTTPQAAQQQMQSAQRDMIRKLEQIERGSAEEVLNVNEALIKAAIEEGTLAQLQQAAPATPAAPASASGGRAPAAPAAAAGGPVAQGGRAPQGTAPAGSPPAAQAGRAPQQAQGAAPASAANAGRATGQAQGAATAAPAQGGAAKTQALPRMNQQQFDQMMSKSQPAVDRFVEAAAKLQLSNKDKKLTPEQLQTQTIELLEKLATEIDGNAPAGFAPEGLALVSDEAEQVKLMNMVRLKAQQLMLSTKSPAEKKTIAWGQLEAPLNASLQAAANKADNFAGLEKDVSQYLHDLLGNPQLAEELIKEKVKPAIENARKAAPAAAPAAPPAAGAPAPGNRR